MPDYNVLMVAPQLLDKTMDPLVLAKDEIDQVVTMLRPSLLSGSQCTIQGLLNIFASDFDIVWFATHGDENGIYLNDGLVSTAELTALMRTAGVRLVVLNTCVSRPVALAIYDELQIKLVCTIKKLPDRTAFVTATLFARMLTRGYSFREAYEKAKPGNNSTYTFLPPEEEDMPPERKPYSLIDDPTDLVNAVRRLQIVVQGDSDYNVKGLAPQVDRATEILNGLVVEVSKLKDSSRFNRNLLWFNFSILIFLFIGLIVLVFQRGIL
jgi:hypothetical protein